jgi:hypothetical protein
MAGDPAISARADRRARRLRAAGLALVVLATGTGPAHAQSGHRITGHAAIETDCSGDRAGELVALEPLALTTITAADGTFAFEDVPDGIYSVVVSPGCPPSSYCIEPVTVEVRGADVTVEVCFNASICAVDHMRLEPQRVRPGGTVDVSGRCYYIHSGHPADVYFDDTIVARVNGSTPGGYDTSFVVPPETPPGEHTVRVVGRGLGTEVGRATLLVTDVIGACVGDCNADGAVSVDELVGGVALLLGGAAQRVGNVARRACRVAFCSGDCGPGPAVRPPDVACLVRAVRNAAAGCPPDPCRGDADCDDGNPLTRDACTSGGCNSACLAASER